jgi:hypothetical protein
MAKLMEEGLSIRVKARIKDVNPEHLSRQCSPI